LIPALTVRWFSPFYNDGKNDVDRVRGFRAAARTILD
jgi:hypothetical protein